MYLLTFYLNEQFTLVLLYFFWHLFKISLNTTTNLYPTSPPSSYKYINTSSSTNLKQPSLYSSRQLLLVCWIKLKIYPVKCLNRATNCTGLTKYKYKIVELVQIQIQIQIQNCRTGTNTNTNTTFLCTHTNGLSYRLLNLLVHLTAFRWIQNLAHHNESKFLLSI